jgi:hypothetical protein
MTADQDSKSAARDALKLRGQALVDKVKELIHQGNVRRLVVKNDKGNTVIEIPVTVGVVAAVAAPVVSAIGAIAALANDWSLEVERREPAEEPEATVIDAQP